ncbi:MAG: hypothetical protein AB8I08_24970 [Sandaracinaceae bacterium]
MDASQEPTAAEARIELLRSEFDATPDRTRQAVLQYEIGNLLQHAMQNEGQAVREYLSAYNLDPAFRPPLVALVSIFERRRSTKNLLRLYDAEARSATTPEEAASALADRAVLIGDHQDQAEEARKLLETAFLRAPAANDIALLLEHQLLAEGDIDAAITVIEKRAELTEDAVLRALLYLEVARAREESDDLDGALEVLRTAVSTPAARWRVLEAMERVARKTERWGELAVALDGQAKLALAESRGEDQGQASGAFSIQRFASQARAQARAAAFHREAARVRLNQLEDPEGATASFEAAMAIRPEDALLRYECMIARELSGDIDGAAAEAEALLGTGIVGPAAGALRFRMAERAQGQGDAEGAASALQEALDADPKSAVAAAMLEDLLLATGEHGALVAQLTARAEAVEGEARAQRYFEAATLAADHLRDAPKARELFSQAAQASGAPGAILREALAAALRLADATGAQQHAKALFACDIDAAERSALLRDVHELERLVLEDDPAADATLGEAVGLDAAQVWAPDLARITAAETHNAELLASAHKALAGRAADEETGAAHLCAAARSYARVGLDDQAVEVLRAALRKSPTHAYAVALLEEVLRARGDADEVVRLLKEAAEQADAPRAAVTQLLLAGAAAEAGDDLERAVQTYQEAAEKDPTSLAPLLAMRRLAEMHDDDATLLAALEALSAREIAAGEAGRHTLALGEHYDVVSGRPDLAEATLKAALASESTALHAAVDLALLPVSGGEARSRIEGLDHMLEQAPESGRRGLLREAAGDALQAGALDVARQKLDTLRDVAPEDRWGPMAQLRLAALDPENGDRAGAWLALGQATDDPEAAAEILLQGLRSHVFGASEEAMDDAVILAEDVKTASADSLAAAVALDEALSAGDDPDGRATALGHWREQAGSAGSVALEAAHGRALAAAGRSREALELLLKVAVAQPDDLASWESIRVCARDCDAWDVVVEACDRLAHIVEDDELTMLLLEESAATLMDELGQDDRAERRLRRILGLDARRPIAYGRLHDLLAERGDDAGLLELVSNRIELVDDVEELGKLFYEQARLLRSLGLREDALNALDNLLMLEPSHVGGLALLVELQVQQENWGGAVDALQKLASAEDVPDSQRRIARLGAADFLQTKLEDLPAAFAELAALHDAGLADLQIYERMAAVAEQLEQWDDAVGALRGAVGASSKPERAARLERRLGAIHAEKRDDPEAAISAFRRALTAQPTDVESGAALAGLVDPAQRTALSQRFEQTLRVLLSEDPTDPRNLRKLARAATWRGDAGVEQLALSVLVALGEASDDEASAFQDRAAGYANVVPRGRLDDAAFQAMRATGDSSAVLGIAQAIAPSVAERDGLELGKLGFSRGDLVREESALARELKGIASAMNLGEVDVYVGGDAPAALELVEYKSKPTWLVGTKVQGPLPVDVRFRAGMLATATRLGVAPLVRLGAERVALMLFAAAQAAESPLPAAQGRAGLEEDARTLYKVLPRKVRKALPAMFASLGAGGRGVDTWSQLILRTTQHGGLLLANDLRAALQRAVGQTPTSELVLASDPAMELLTFWLSPGALQLRRTLGLSA